MQEATPPSHTLPSREILLISSVRPYTGLDIRPDIHVSDRLSNPVSGISRHPAAGISGIYQIDAHQ